MASNFSSVDTHSLVAPPAESVSGSLSNEDLSTSGLAKVPGVNANQTEVSLKQAELLVPKAEEDDACIPEVMSEHTQSRIEALMEQQNALLLRQLQLAEESGRSTKGRVSQCMKPQQFLKTVDPCVRGIFAAWYKDFRTNVGMYVAQSDLSMQYQAMTSKGALLKPFCHESRTPWDWTPFYRFIAKPIDGIDAVLPDGMSAGLVQANGNAADAPMSSERPHIYDIDSAFAELRSKHAWELQTFVVAHQKKCLEKIIEENALPNQICVLEGRLQAWFAEHTGVFQLQALQDLACQAKHFVELVYRDEMPKAEVQIKEGKAPSAMFIITMRVICMLVVLIALLTMSHELLMKLFAVMFALGCGMALLWEDLVKCTLQLLIGETRRRLGVLGSMQQIGAMPQLVRVHFPTIVW